MCTHVFVTVKVEEKEAMNLRESKRSMSKVGRKGGGKLKSYFKFENIHESLIFYCEVGEAELSHTCVTNGH